MIVHLLLACHNRRSMTIRAIQDAAGSASAAGLNARFVLYDDGSTDGTADAVRDLELPVTVVSGDGTAFWAKSMSVAERRALTEATDEDWLVWLNDDVYLDRDAFTRLVSRLIGDMILVGAMRDPDSGDVSYSGFRRVGWHPLGFTIVEPGDQLQPIDAFNGNLVCVPVPVARTLGGIDGEFSHAWADIDYGLRAREAGVPVLLAPGTYGTCPRNVPNHSGSILARWRRHRCRKGGGEPASIERLIRRHEPAKWPWAQWASVALWWIREGGAKLRGRRG